MANRLVLLALLVSPFLASAEKVQTIAPCSRGAGYGTANIQEVRITPCPEANSRRPCVLKKGTSVTIEVDFTPTVAASEVSAKAFWANRAVELPLPNMNSKACETLSCPLTPNTRQTYRYILPVARSFPNVSSLSHDDAFWNVS